jgi:hypothetical protein
MLNEKNEKGDRFIFLKERLTLQNFASNSTNNYPQHPAAMRVVGRNHRFSPLSLTAGNQIKDGQ